MLFIWRLEDFMISMPFRSPGEAVNVDNISHVWSASISWYVSTPVTGEQKNFPVFLLVSDFLRQKMALQPSPINIAEMKALMQ